MFYFVRSLVLLLFNIAWNLLLSRCVAHLLSRQCENECHAPVVHTVLVINYTNA